MASDRFNEMTNEQAIKELAKLGIVFGKGERKTSMKLYSSNDNDTRDTAPADDREDHGISTYDDDEARRIKISKTGLKIGAAKCKQED